MIGLDWRAPGYNWTKTEFGWRALQQRSNRPQAAAVNNSQSDQLQQNVWKRDQLEQRCVKVIQYSSRESSNYVTIGAAITKLNFLCAVKDQNCFSYIYEVITELFNNHWSSLSSGTQNLIIKVIEAIKNAAVENKIHYVKAVKLISRAVTVLKEGTTFVCQSQRNKIHRDIVTLQKWKEQLFNSLVCDEPYDLQQGDLLELPSVVLHHVISYLTDPRDLLNFGLTHPLLYEMTEEPRVWYNLCVLHHEETPSISAIPKHNWKKRYSLLQKKCNPVTTSNVLQMCPMCSGLFWKWYGHPCTITQQQQQQQQSGQQQQYKIISPKQFIEILYF